MGSVRLLVLLAACVDVTPEDGGTFVPADPRPATSPAPADPSTPTLPSTPTVPEVEPLPAMVDQAVPLIGGTVAIGADWVAASDTDGDAIELIHRWDGFGNRLQLETHATPAALAITATVAPERVHVILRGNHTLLVIEPVSNGAATIVAQRAVCATPTGLAWDAARERMWITCAAGELVEADADGMVLSTTMLDTDLRDLVILDDGSALVARVRSAEVLVVNLDDGSIVRRWKPRTQGDERVFVPRTLRRLVPGAAGGALALFQAHDTGTIDIDEDVQNEALYGGTECSSIVRTVVAEVSAGFGFAEPTLVDAQQGLPIDLVAQEDGTLLVATPNGVVTDWDYPFAIMTEPCMEPRALVDGTGLATSIARSGSDVFVVMREPFSLGDLEAIEPVPGTTRSGLSTFHESPDGVACASCHFDGGDDAHVWNFSTGARRTQQLGGLAISETAPFHWSGDLPTFKHLFEEVGVDRMGMTTLFGQDLDLLLGFLDALPAPARLTPESDPDLVTEGAILFGDATVGCAECHSGWRYSSLESEDVGTGGVFQVPSLIGVASRLPLMHDGCADTMRRRFDDPVCGGTSHGDVSGLSSAQIDALVAFLESL